MSAKKDVKKNVLPHSKAKLDLYKDYLSEYLPILGHTPYVSRINLFDIFCGQGLYEDGNLGSPLIAASCILNYIMNFNERGKAVKPIRLVINDFDVNKINGVTDLLEGLPLANCEIEAYNLDADKMFEEVINKLNSYKRDERNLVFIDPYGYSKINKQNLASILNNNRTEVILFLPVAQMYRFSEKAQTSFEAKCYDNLRRFIHEFFDEKSKVITGEKIDIFDYIEELRKAFSFKDKFYTSAHYIQRDTSNYYAVFFIGHHIYGLEKFLEVKWKNDSLGKGFNQNSNIQSLFSEGQLQEYDKNLTERRIEEILKEYLKNVKVTTNVELYKFTLTNQFLPTHINGVLRKLKSEKKIILCDKVGNAINVSNGFGITHKNYKEKNTLYYFKLAR